MIRFMVSLMILTFLFTSCGNGDGNIVQRFITASNKSDIAELNRLSDNDIIFINNTDTLRGINAFIAK